MGGIDLDPASSAAANEVVKADKYLSVAENGLDADWHGRVWMNPPYAMPLIEQFAAKLAAEVSASRVKQAIVLVNNATDTAWFADLASASSAVCFPRGRIRFWNPSGDKGAPLQGQAMLYVGHRVDRFVKEYKQYGTVWTIA